MKTFKLEVTLKVSENWVADGFGFANKKEKKEFTEQIEETLQNNLLTYAYGSEFYAKCKVIEAPDMKIQAKLMGY